MTFLLRVADNLCLVGRDARSVVVHLCDRLRDLTHLLDQGLRVWDQSTAIRMIKPPMIVAWCELRKGLRHFRVDRMVSVSGDVGAFKGQGSALLAEWERTQKAATVDTVAL